MTNPDDQRIRKSRSSADLELLKKIPFFEAIPLEAKYKLLATVHLKHLKAGEKMIKQGDEGDEFYIIRNGKCAVNLEKEGVRHLVGRLGPGKIVGEMAILTGEKRSADVDALTDMDLWAISRESFDKTCVEFPTLKRFLTKLVTDRLSHSLLMAERSIGKYIIEKTIGVGGSSVVYRGYHSSLNIPVAIKMLRHDRAMDPLFLEKFRNEAKTIAQLNHENILKVYDVEELYRTFFIIMEHVEGMSLGHVLARVEPPPMPKLLHFLISICSGLQHAHEKGVVHRDIKPGNVVVQKDDTVKLVDFGFACAPGTKDRNIIGTEHYLSPEIIKVGPVDERADIYSLGIMAYEMFTGRNPCPERDTADILNWHLKHDVKDPRKVVPDLPNELSAFIRRASRRDPADRYRGLAQALYDLDPLAERMGLRSQRESAERLNMTSLYLFYRDEHRAIMQRLLNDFSREVEKVGARLRGASFKDVQR